MPLVTFLFMAAVMFPLFVPQTFVLDKLLRAQIAFVMVIAAYLAEVVRAGLEAVPKGQYEAACQPGAAVLARDDRSCCRRRCASRFRRSSTRSSPSSRTRRSSRSSG